MPVDASSMVVSCCTEAVPETVVSPVKLLIPARPSTSSVAVPVSATVRALRVIAPVVALLIAANCVAVGSFVSVTALSAVT